VTYLAIVSWNFVANGVIFSCSSMFQGIGNTWPALSSAAPRLLTYVLPAAWLTARPRRELTDLWYIYSASVWLQAATSLLLLQGQFRRRLPLVLAPAAELDESKPTS
jgi:Na+-driven multidrug efflux pump